MSALNRASKEAWHDEPLSFIVYGASGDLAKKKTYPSLFDLYCEKLLPKHTLICGYARTKTSEADFRAKIRPYLTSRRPKATTKELDGFLSICLYRSGQYDSASDAESAVADVRKLHGKPKIENRVFYFALPPSEFLNAARGVQAAITPGEEGIKLDMYAEVEEEMQSLMIDKSLGEGFNRVIVEKPFGKDTESAEKLGEQLGEIFPESMIYRIDHYLGKEVTQAMTTLRFANSWLEPLLNGQNVRSVIFSFKEDIGTEGRGGYFDKSGIIRDIMQNHLMQVLSILAMEPPSKVFGEGASDLIRDEKVKVLKAIKPWKSATTVLGQYTGNGKEPGYLDDKTVPAGSHCPTYACTVMKVNNRRWAGVPFIMKAGKALNERKCEVRIQLKAPPGVDSMFDLGDDEGEMPLNEIVLRLQPNEAVYIKTNIKSPGLSNEVMMSEVDLTYKRRYPDTSVPDAYTRLILDCLRANQQNFVRQDELMEAWKIVTPLLKEIEDGKVEPEPYRFGSRGPKNADKLIRKKGKFKLQPKYKWVEPK